MSRKKNIKKKPKRSSIRARVIVASSLVAKGATVVTANVAAFTLSATTGGWTTVPLLLGASVTYTKINCLNDRITDKLLANSPEAKNAAAEKFITSLVAVDFNKAAEGVPDTPVRDVTPPPPPGIR